MNDTQAPIGPGSLVCVTGANGFIASHLIRLLLEQGRRVRGTVRDPANEAKVSHLKGLPGADELLELVPADLLEEGSFDEAIKGCDGVFHCAAAVFFAAADPQTAIVDPSVRGTRNVFSAIAKSGSVRRVVHTSSIAAVYDYTKPHDHRFTEADWNDASTLEVDAYGLAKVSAEREALRMHGEQPESERYSLVHLNPGMVWGPPLVKAHAKASPLLIRDILSGGRPGTPKLHLGIVDVRDVAAIHLQAMDRPELSGRYILVGDHAWMPEVATRLATLFPELDFPTRSLPKLLVLAAALFEETLNVRQLRKLLNHPFHYDASRAERDFDIDFRPLDTTLSDTGRPMIDRGWARTKRR